MRRTCWVPLFVVLIACAPEADQPGPAPEPLERALVDQLADTDPAVRRQAAEALGRLETASLDEIRALVAAQHDEDESVGDAARNALHRLRPTPDIARLPPTQRTGEVMVQPAQTSWRKVACEPLNLAEGEVQGECWVLAWIPPVYETRTAQIQLHPRANVWRMVEDDEDPADVDPAPSPPPTPPDPLPPAANTPAGMPPNVGLGEVWCEVRGSAGREWRRNRGCEEPPLPR